MEAVSTIIIFHRQKNCIGLYFKRDKVLQQKLQNNIQALWSSTHKCWYCINNAKNIAYLKNELGIILNPSQPLAAEKVTTGKNVSASDNDIKPIAQKQPKKSLYHTLSVGNKKNLEQYIQLLNLKAYSNSTQRTYVNEFISFLALLQQTNAAELPVNKIKDYFEYCYTGLGLSENTLHSKINALKFFYEQVLHKEKFFWDIPRPKKHLILPKILGESELIKLFAAPSNLKHKAILFTAYSAGLRVSEVVNLRLQDIDRERGQLFINCSKGKKDRYVKLSPLLLDILESYYKMCNPRPQKYLFEGAFPGEAYSVRSAQIIFSEARKKAGISKQVSFHCLRHSFATHLLEKGVDVKYIKDILGHFNIKTTERYLHIRREFLVNIDSPLDNLYRDSPNS